MTNEEIVIMAGKAGLVPVEDLPKANHQKDLEDFLRRVALCVKQAAEAGHKECRFRVNGIPNTPLHVMEAAIEPLKAFGYGARMAMEGGLVSIIPPVVTKPEAFLVVNGWGD